jgi:hypothetical protein
MQQATELLENAKEKLASAKSLCDLGQLGNARYLCGYAVELSLKHRICVVRNMTHFPVTAKEFKAMNCIDIKTHDFDLLLHESGKESLIKNQHLADWSYIKQWSPQLRYELSGKATVVDTKYMISVVERLLAVL